jgi:hypothetical protein
MTFAIGFFNNGSTLSQLCYKLQEIDWQPRANWSHSCRDCQADIFADFVSNSFPINQVAYTLQHALQIHICEGNIELEDACA